jgi:hypothetical protein
MLQSHFVSLLLFSSLVSLVLTFLQREDPKARWRFGLKVFAGFVLSTFVIGWVMAQLQR